MKIMNETKCYPSETELWSTLRTTRSAKASLESSNTHGSFIQILGQQNLV